MKLRSVSNPGLVQRAAPDVAFAQLAGRSGGEVLDALLRPNALVEMLVAGERKVDAVFLQQRFDERPERQVGSVSFARRVDRMMHEHDLPLCCRLRELSLEPVQLPRAHVAAVEREELCRSLAERIEPFAVHVERLVSHLDGRVVVVAERRIERHFPVHQRAIRLFELQKEIACGLAAVQVIAEHQDERERKFLAGVAQLFAGFVLPAASAPTVANDRKLQRIASTRRRDLGAASQLREKQQRGEENNLPPPDHVRSGALSAAGAGVNGWRGTTRSRTDFTTCPTRNELLKMCSTRSGPASL
jgi:hypothetical protein